MSENVRLLLRILISTHARINENVSIHSKDRKPSLASLAPPRDIFCKSLPFLRRRVFCLDIFWHISYNNRRQLIFSLVRRRWSQHPRRVHCHTWIGMTALVSIVSDNMLCVSIY